MSEQHTGPVHSTVPVLIVGAGLGGLATATFLGLHGVPALVVERHRCLSSQPKARGQAPATMEALGIAGLAQRYADASPPGRPGMRIVIAESMAGSVLHSFTETMPDFSAYSPAPACLVSQERSERILAGRAAELGAEIRFSTELVSFEQHDDHVLACLRDCVTGEDSTVAAGYLVAADGHKGGIRDALGIGVHGRRKATADSALFAQFAVADPDKFDVALDGMAVGLWHIHNPGLPRGVATVVTTDQPGRFVFGGAFSSDDASPERLTRHIRTATGIPDLEVKILETGWTTSGTYITRVADRFREGRILLVGDAAHLMPPTGGQGGNAAVLDGYHLAWKIAAVLSGQATQALLDSHDAERRPYADLLAEQQYANFVQRIAPHLNDDTVAEIVDPATGLFGYICPAGAFVPEPAQWQPLEDPAHPTGRPGARAPHLILADGSSTRDLFGHGFVLLTSGRAEPWAAAADGLDVTVVTVPDEDGRVRAAYGVTGTAGSLVRPDGIVAWRSGEPAGLRSAMRTITGRL
jgi:putative polyketide hydroxylase